MNVQGFQRCGAIHPAGFVKECASEKRPVMRAPSNGRVITLRFLRTGEKSTIYHSKVSTEQLARKAAEAFLTFGDDYFSFP